MPKLTADLILRSESYLNPLNDRELDLRGLQIPAIENLGVTKDQLDSIDLSDNALHSISNLPKLLRLKHMVAANNPITTITPLLATACPHLVSLVLTSSHLKELKDLDPLGACKHLEFLSLKDAPVALVQYYREWNIHRCRKLRVLDFEKVKDKERKRAEELFLTLSNGPTSLALSISSAAASLATGVPLLPTAAAGKLLEPGGDKGRLLSDDERARVNAAIRGATSVEEVRKLKRMLEEGYVPDIRVLKAPTEGDTTGVTP